MPLELISIAVLVAIFLLSSLLKLHMGALALVAAFVLGVGVVGESADDVLSGFPSGLFVILVGVTFLFAIAQGNGTIDWIVDRAVRLVGGRVWALPWVIFALAAGLAAAGAVPPAAVAIIVPTAMGLAYRNGIPPLYMGLMVANGVGAGEFSPIGVFGVIVNGLAAQSGLEYSAGLLFLSTFLFSTFIGVGLHFWFARPAARRARAAEPDSPDATPDHGFSSGAGGRSKGTILAAAPAPTLERTRLTTPIVVTLLGIMGMVAAVLFFRADIGFTALTVALIASVASPEAGKQAIPKIAWPTVFLIVGIVTYVGLLSRMGTIDYVGQSVESIGAPLLGALLLCVVGAAVSAFASTTGILGALVPLAVPFILAGGVNSVPMLIALSIASSVVDSSPFSTSGALVIANTDPADRDRVFTQLLRWGLSMIVAAPLTAWAIFILPGW
ncbi:SLC13 family permease [Pseudarthrobacter sp. NPDC055928]|uniref:SLC13 family permease n=1 Tax=Pseudarthrobacter sp. NPDC055928 TaxID=3345661 RepID=UPI0035D7497A